MLTATLLAACADPPALPVDAARTDQAAVVDQLAPTDINVDTGVDAPAPIDRSPMDASADLGVDAPVTIDVPAVDVPTLCVPGRSERCTCGDGAVGARTCDERGAYGECRCVMGDGGVWDPPLVLPPRLIAPRSVSRATTQRPTFRWVMPEGMTRARITLARDRTLTREVRSTVVEGARWRPTELLPHAVWFWRVEALAADNRVVWTSATWEFQSPWRDTAVDSSWGPIWDTNGDGYDDLVMWSDFNLAVVQGASSLSAVTFRSVPRMSSTHVINRESASVGDFNGDSFSDVAVTLSSSTGMMREEVLVYLGGVGGISTSPQLRLVQPVEPSLRLLWGGVLSACDWNGDGYSDLVVTHTCVVADGCRDELPALVEIHLGSASGVESTPTIRLRDDRATAGSWYRASTDVNDDGYGDLVNVVGASPSRQVYLTFGGPETVRGGVVGQRDLGPARSNHAARIRTLGDVDGDGNVEVLAGGYDEAVIYAGGVEVGSTVFQRLEAPDRPTSYGPGEFGAYLGCSGDLNGDGYSDPLLASPLVPLQENFGYGPGRLYVYGGSADGLSPTPIHALSGTGRLQQFGNESVGCVDLDGDGRTELYVGESSPLDPPRVFRGDPEWNFVPASLTLPGSETTIFFLFRDLALRPAVVQWVG